MLTYHGCHELKGRVLEEIKQHQLADAIVQGTYWRDGKGCAVGCLTQEPTGGHNQYEGRWGIPAEMAWLEDAIFEGLSVGASKVWPMEFMSAIPVGVEIDPETFFRVLSARRIMAEIVPLIPHLDSAYQPIMWKAVANSLSGLADPAMRPFRQKEVKSAQKKIGPIGRPIGPQMALATMALATMEAMLLDVDYDGVALRSLVRFIEVAELDYGDDPGTPTAITEAAWSREASRVLALLTGLI